MTEPDEALLWAREQALGYTNPALRDEICGGLWDHDFGIPELARGYRAGAAASAERIKALEARVAELERRLSGGVGGEPGGPNDGPRSGHYFDNGKAMFGGRGGGGQG